MIDSSSLSSSSSFLLLLLLLLLLINSDIDINNDSISNHVYCYTNGIDHGECDDTYAVLIGEYPTIREYDDALESMEEDEEDGDELD